MVAGIVPRPQHERPNQMTKTTIVKGAVVSPAVAKLLEARDAFAVGFGSTYGLSKVYAAAMLELYPFAAKDKKPLFSPEAVTEFETWKGAATIAASKAGVDTGSEAFKAKLRDQVREVRKQAAIICGLEVAKGAKANEARATIDWLKDEAPKWLKRVNKDESGDAKVVKAFEDIAKLCKDLGLNPDAIIAESNT